MRDADTDVLHLAADEGSGGHASSISFAPGAGLLTLGGGAVTPQSCRDRRSDESPGRTRYRIAGAAACERQQQGEFMRAQRSERLMKALPRPFQQTEDEVFGRESEKFN